MKIEDLIMNRRLFLKGQLGGLATLMGLPFLESIFGRSAYADTFGSKALRFACFYHPNGVIQDRAGDNLEGFPYFPYRTSKTEFNLRSSNLIPLADLGLKDYLTIIEGVRTRGTTGKQHMEAISGFLSGKALTDAGSRKMSPSIDQILLDKIAGGVQNSAFYFIGNPQLHKPQNNRDNNALKNALCFDTSGGFRTPRNDYKTVFDELFAGIDGGETNREISRRDALQLSVLDSVRDSREFINSQVNAADRTRLEEYYDRIRTTERNINSLYEKSASDNSRTCTVNNSFRSSLQNYDPTPTNNNIIHDVESITDNINEMMAIGFACDRVRIFTYMFGGEVAGCRYRNLNINEDFHVLSHKTDPENLKKHRVIDRWHIRKVGEFAKKLSQIDDGEGKSVLDNTVILSGSGLAKGYSHSFDPLPIILLGKAGGGIPGGRYLKVSGDDKPTGVLLSSIVKAMGHGNVAIGDNRNSRTYSLS